MMRLVSTAFVFLSVFFASAAPANADLLRILSFAPASGFEGTTVVLNGTGMSGVTAVKFDGVAAKFTINTARKITTSVPDGATTGRITVTKGTTTATSATDFTVTIPPEFIPWSTFQHDPQHTGKAAATGPSSSTVHVDWSYKGVSWIKNQVSIGPDGTIFIGDAKFPLCALNPTGTRRWCTNVGGYVNQSSPAIGNAFTKIDGLGSRTVQTVYIGDRNNVFWAIDSEGDPLWSYKIPLDGDVRQSPIIGPTNTVYMMCGCTTRGVLHAFDPDGNLTWVVNLPQVRESSPAAIQFGPFFRLYVVTNSGVLHAIDDRGTHGQIVWTLSLGADVAHASPSIGPDGTIYVGTDEGLFAVKDNGTSGSIKAGWPFPTSGAIDTAASISNGKLFVSSYRVGIRTFYAINPATNPPTQLWSFSGQGTSSTSFAQTPSAVIGGNGLVYAAIGSDIYAFDPGSATPATPRWHYDLPDDAISLTLGEGVLYVSAKDSRLYALVAGP